MYRFHPTPEKQIWQRLSARDEGEDPHPGGAPPLRNSESFPPGCSAGKVNTDVGLFHLFVFLLWQRKIKALLDHSFLKLYGNCDLIN